jgi:DNA-binding CsgD family transcriptional regulator
MPDEIPGCMARAISTAGSPPYVENLVDLIASLVGHDLVTVTRYSATHPPEFVLHRNFSDHMVLKYLEIFYPYDPFYRYWRTHRQAGVMPLSRLAIRDVKRGRYIAEFLNQSVISDELGVILHDGSDWCLGIFLDRNSGKFRPAEIGRLESYFPVLAALHELHLRLRIPQSAMANHEPAARLVPKLDEITGLWLELSARERQLVELVLAGHPSAAIAKRLGITLGTVKNHRGRIYKKLDITTERELFLQYFEYLSVSNRKA